MKSISDLANDVCGPYYQPGEHLVIATRVASKGARRAQASFGVAGGFIADAIKARTETKHLEQGTATGLPDLPSVTLVLTNRRLLVCRNSSVASQPQDVAATLNLTDIADARFEKHHLAKKLFITTADGTETQYDANGSKDPAEFVEALLSALSPAAS